MNLNQVNKPAFTIAHILTTAGLMGGVLVFANEVENKGERTATKQEMIMQSQIEMKADIKEGRQKQEQALQLLYRIEAQLKARDNGR